MRIYFDKNMNTLIVSWADILEDSKEATIFKSFKGLLIFLAVFCLSAFKKTSGWKRSDKFNELLSKLLLRNVSTHFFNWYTREQNPFNQLFALSGPSHTLLHLSGTFPSMRSMPVAWISLVSKPFPNNTWMKIYQTQSFIAIYITLSRPSIEISIFSSIWYAVDASRYTNDSMGSVERRFSDFSCGKPLPSLNYLYRFFQRLMIAPSYFCHFSLSNLRSSALAYMITFKLDTTYCVLYLWTALSTF